jgi:hypothetical protein
MDQGEMEFSIPLMLTNVDKDEMPPREAERLQQAWKSVRTKVGALAGKD